MSDLVMTHFGKERAPTGNYSKLHDRRLGPFKIIHKAGDNAFVLELPDHLQVSPTFNISDLIEYFPPYEGFSLLTDSGEFCFQEDIDAGA